MDASSKDASIPVPVVVVLYDFHYTSKDSREISVRKGEKLYLIEKTNKDWWQVVRNSERRSFYVPAQYVEELKKDKPRHENVGPSSAFTYDDTVEYENLNSLILKQKDDLPSLSNVTKTNRDPIKRSEMDVNKAQDINKEKPVPKTRTKVLARKNSYENADVVKSSKPELKSSLSQGVDNDKGDKRNDKLKYGDKITQDLSLSLPKNSDQLNLQSDGRTCSSRNIGSFDNAVYPNVAVGKTKINVTGKGKIKSGDARGKIDVDPGKNRMKNSYNLKVKPSNSFDYHQVSASKLEKNKSVPLLKNEKTKLSKNLSKSLEKLAEEIKFEPKRKEETERRQSMEHYSKAKPLKMQRDNLRNKKGRADDASVILDENKTAQQRSSVFSRFRRSLHHSSSFKSRNQKKLGKSSKEVCELSLSWEGGLDKIDEREEKPQSTSGGLQRSQTFMVADRSPMTFRQNNKIFSVKNRLDVAYHSQRLPPEEKVTLSTFKPKTIIHQVEKYQAKSTSPVLKEIDIEPIKKEEEEANLEQAQDGKNKKSVYENVAVAVSDPNSQVLGKGNLVFYNETYSNSEPEDNLEEKSLTSTTVEAVVDKSLKSQSSVDSNITLSEGTELSESDDNGSLDLDSDKRMESSTQQMNKRRTSLVRSKRVETSKARTVTARPPPTPTPEERPMKDLGDGWGAYCSKDGRSYYYNENTGEKNWKPPRRKIAGQEKRLDGSRESVYSDISSSLTRSNTSSPLNDRCNLSNQSLNRSNASLNSRSTYFENSGGFDRSKSGSVYRSKEESPDDLNRSSYNSSPVTGQSRSSSYSLNKSSRDSLNRFSPVENIPSEDEGLELNDHVYQEDPNEKRRKQKLKLFESKRKSDESFKGGESVISEEAKEEAHSPKVPIPEGWQECYDDNMKQLCYIHNGTKQKKHFIYEEKHPDLCPLTIQENSKVDQKLPYEPINNVHRKEEDPFQEILRNLKNEIGEFEERMAIFEKQNGDYDYYPEKRNSLPSNFSPTSKYRYYNINNIFDDGVIKEKPPVPPKRKKSEEMDDRKLKPFAGQRRKLSKALLAKFENPETFQGKTLEECGYETVGEIRAEVEKLKEQEGCLTPEEIVRTVVDGNEEEVNEAKPFPFPVDEEKGNEVEYEMHELLMMKRVTESSKERRKPSIERRVSLNYTIHEENVDENENVNQEETKTSQKPKNIELARLESLEESKVAIRGYQNQIIKFLDSKVRTFLKPGQIPRLREDVIIDWAHDYENLNEPVVMQSKSLYFQKQRMAESIKKTEETQTEEEGDAKKEEKVTEIENVNEDPENMKGVDNDENVVKTFEKATSTETNIQKGLSHEGDSSQQEMILSQEENLKISDVGHVDKMSVNSDDTIASYSDFESDINEAIAIGETWCNEGAEESLFSEEEENPKQKLRRLCNNKIEPFAAPERSWSDNRLDTILEDDERPSRNSLQITLHLVKTSVTSKSEEDLLKKLKSEPLNKNLSKSLDYFNDPLAEQRVKCCGSVGRSDSMSSDVVDWMVRMRGIIYGEDKFFADDDEWYSSCDTEGRVYFFEENSNESSWALPDLTPEDTREGFNFNIQRSATESAISKTNESSAKLRHTSKNGDKSGGRVSSATRSSKTQSMVIEPKLDFSSKDDTKTFSMPRDLSKIYGEIIRTGMLNKTKIAENGKKLRKNWTPAFVVLSENYLFFFKDVKSFQNMKNVINPNSNHMCLSLKGAVIERGEKISSRKNVYKISCSDNTEVLVQTDKTSEADDWCKDINLVIQKLPQEPVNTSSSSSIDPNSPSKVGRTKSLKVKIKEAGSMEDLSASPEERQNKIKAKLKKFFNRRPTVDSLKKKGIYKDEPVFGCSLEQITKNRKPRVPIFVQECVKYIESKEENMKTDGLYRASGNLSQVQKIRLEVDQNNLSIMRDEEDVHVLTGSLKLFFRELKEPLIPFKQLETALHATDKPSRKEKIKDFQKLVKSLPEPNYDTLKFLLQHLIKVKEYQEYNRMNISNLAIVFGPTLMWPEQESANMALELMQQNVVIECLLKEFHEIFIH